MLFNSFSFLLVFFPLVLLVACRARGRLLIVWLTLASLVFYGFAGHAWFLAPMLFTTVLDFFVAQAIAAAPARGRRARTLLTLSLTANLGLLAYFKYARLVIETIGQAAGTSGLPAWTALFDVVLPAGISFYTFQTMSYVIDVYRGTAHPERRFLTFALFVSFFPHLVAGPLTRHNQLIPALDRIERQGTRPRWREGVYLFSIGLCKKVLIADRLAAFIDPGLNQPAHLTVAAAWLAVMGFALQIYMDFSGYSDMAIGLGRLLGVELPQNFASPYRATSPSDFWRRWHITLSSWLRDYLYVSLGGNRGSSARTALNLMITMTLGGLWHGANWTFAIWGVYHGLLLVLFRRWAKPWERLPVALQRFVTLVLVCIGWIFFRAQTLHDAGTIIARLFVPGPASEVIEPSRTDYLSLVALLLVGGAVALNRRTASSDEHLGRFGPWRSAALGLTTAAAVVFMGQSAKFLYFQF